MSAQSPISPFPEARSVVYNFGTLVYKLSSAANAVTNVPVPAGFTCVALSGDTNYHVSANGVPTYNANNVLYTTQPQYVINPAFRVCNTAVSANLVIYTPIAGNVTLEWFNVSVGP